MDEKEAASAARLSVIEMLLTLLLVEFTKTQAADPRAEIERLRATLWNTNPDLLGLDPQTAKVFRREWERRIDILLDDAADLLRGSSSP